MHFFNVMMAHAIPFLPRALIQRVSRRYIAGQDLNQAISRIQRLNEDAFPVTVDVLGESATTAEQADAKMKEYEAVLAEIVRLQLRASISVKPTAMGILLDFRQCQARIERLLHLARAAATDVCLDMEDVGCTQREIDLFLALSSQHDNLGLAVQAYLKRTYRDLDVLLLNKSQLRICKGIYVEHPLHLVEEACKDRSAINSHFMAHVKRCFEARAFVAIATHDRKLIDMVLALVQRLDIGADQFEFQMLLGVCELLRDELRAQGFQVRIYVPYGQDWHGYSVRRIKENPQIAGHLVRALIGR